MLSSLISPFRQQLSASIHLEMSKNVMIIGGHGQVSLRLARLLSPSHNITSTIRTISHESDITSLGPTVKPLVISLEDDPVEKFATVFQGQDVVYFCAGAGGNGGDERTKKVDFEGAIKVFDAIEQAGDTPETRPRLVLVSSIDARDPEKIPAHYVRISFLGPHYVLKTSLVVID